MAICLEERRPDEHFGGINKCPRNCISFFFFFLEVAIEHDNTDLLQYMYTCSCEAGLSKQPAK